MAFYLLDVYAENTFYNIIHSLTKTVQLCSNVYHQEMKAIPIGYVILSKRIINNIFEKYY